MTSAARNPIPLLPDPEPSELKYTFISVDDHLVEPPDVFEGRMPRALQEQAPKVQPRGAAAGFPIAGKPEPIASKEPAKNNQPAISPCRLPHLK